MKEIKIRSTKREELIDITKKVEELIKGVKEGVVFLYVPHATAGITINENYDPNVNEDILEFLRNLIPKGRWKHDKIDDNADAHIKSSLIGVNQLIPVKDGKLLLGKWQSISLCEFDGPRERTIIVKTLE
ncbi:MAG: secondary thiamine-phosphate synthase enzyme YjbQ [Candidatus Nanoarchaeia archaeon]